MVAAEDGLEPGDQRLEVVRQVGICGELGQLLFGRRELVLRIQQNQLASAERVAKFAADPDLRTTSSR